MSIRTIFHPELFRDRVALVTGGGTGIGFRTATELAYLGCTVYIASRNTKRLEEAATAINKYLQGHPTAGAVIPVELNIRDRSSRTRCIDTILEKEKQIDYLVGYRLCILRE